MQPRIAMGLAAVASGAAVVAIVWRTVGSSDPAPPPAPVRQPVAEVPVRVAPVLPAPDRSQPPAGAAPALTAQPGPPPQELLDAIRRAKAAAPSGSGASAPVQPAMSFEDAIALARARQQQTQTVVTNPFGPPQK